MDTAKVLIADHNHEMRQIETKIVAMAIGCDLAGEAHDGNELMALLEENRPHIVLMNQDLRPLTGLDYAKQIEDLDPSILLIFVSNTVDEISNELALHAFDNITQLGKNTNYAVKVIEKARNRILGNIDRSLPTPNQKKHSSHSRIMLRHKEGVAFVAMDDILLIQREDRSTVIYTVAGGRYITSESLSETEARLDHDIFYRCHKSYIINLNRINSITPYGRWTYVVKLDGTNHDALITHDKYEELIQLFS